MSIQSKAAHREHGREQGRERVRDEVTEQGQQRGRQAASTFEERALYVISVAADLAGVHPQTLRIYERKGLLSPQRTAGNTRRYSERDVERLRQIQRLTQDEGVNLAGVRIIMEMQRRLDEAQAQLEGPSPDGGGAASGRASAGRPHGAQATPLGGTRPPRRRATDLRTGRVMH